MLVLASLTLLTVGDLSAAETFTKVTSGPGSDTGNSRGARGVINSAMASSSCLFFQTLAGEFTVAFMAEADSSDHWPASGREFTTTHWSVVLAANDGASTQSHTALAQLCRTYWYPLYAFVRRKGHSPHDAQDLTQAFFARLLEKNTSSRRRERGGSALSANGAHHFLADDGTRRGV
jgi:hypothetical protein